MPSLNFKYSLGILIWVFFQGITFGQAPDQATALTPFSPDSTLQAILLQKNNLVQQEQALRNQGTSLQALVTWHQQHAAQFAAIAQQLQTWSSLQPQPTLPAPTSASIPANATPEMKEYLMNRIQLATNVLPSQSTVSSAPLSSVATSNITSVASVQSVQAVQAVQPNATLIQRQQQLAQIIASQPEAVMPPPPGTPRIPDSAPAQLKAYLVAHDALVKAAIQVESQYASSAPNVRQAAVQQGYAQNAAKFQSVQQLAKALPQVNPTTQN